MARTKKTQEATPEAKQDNGLLTLKEAAAYLEVTEQRVRTLLREKRVEAVKNDKGYWRVTKEALDSYNATKGQRVSGRKAFVVRLTPEELEALNTFIGEQGWEEVTVEPRYNYDPAKAKAYREQRAAKLAAEAEAETAEA